MSNALTRHVPPQVAVRNLQRAVAISTEKLQEFARRAVRLCLRSRRPKQTELMKLRKVSILIISDRRIATLHKKFLHQTGPTDVLTFQHGEIFISAETARRHARQFGNSLDDELRLYIVHGLLHLHGFDDLNLADAKKMNAVQRRILRAARK